jgi:hypothetical protein
VDEERGITRAGKTKRRLTDPHQSDGVVKIYAAGSGFSGAFFGGSPPRVFALTFAPRFRFFFLLSLRFYFLRRLRVRRFHTADVFQINVNLLCTRSYAGFSSVASDYADS